MTAVTIRPTFKKDSRPNNGLETIADEMIADNSKVFYVVGTVKWAGGSLSEEGELLPAAKFLAIEPLTEGSSAEELAKKILDDARKARGLGRIEEQAAAGQMAGQQPFDFDGPDEGEPRRVGEVRLGADGPREVPPPSAEEELAERKEAKAKAAPTAKFSGGEAK